MLAPDALSVAGEPEHIVDGDAFAATSGSGFTVIEMDAVEVQPAAEVPVTVYVPDDAGVIETDEPVPPELQLYVLAPVAVNVVLLPEQTELFVAETPTTGEEFTIIETVAVPVQPKVVVPVTVYEVVLVGETLIVEPVPPELQLYEFAPVAVMEVELPLQIDAGVAVAETVAALFTVTFVVAVTLQLPLVTVTVYVPDASGVAFEMLGFCKVLVNPFGPDQLYPEAPFGVTERFNV